MVRVALIQAFPFSFRLEITKFNFDEVISDGACRQSNSLLFLSESMFFPFIYQDFYNFMELKYRQFNLFRFFF